MARFAPVVPVQIAEPLQAGQMRDDLGAYHLLLAHDIIDKPKPYQRIYGRVRDNYPETSFIIMDNSIIELGKAMEIKDLLHASEILVPDCIVIPDIMGDAEATKAKAIEFCRDYTRAAFAKDGDAANVPSLMGVLQGETVAEVLETLLTFYALPMVDYIGIPRVITKQQGSRMPSILAIQKSAARTSFKGFHMLGFSDNIIDDISCARVPFINGIDSAVLARAGIEKLPLDLNDFEWSNKVGPRGDFWEQKISDATTDTIIRNNLEQYRKLIRSR